MQTDHAVLAGVLALMPGAAAPADGEIVLPVFHIAKSDSRNQVQYRGVLGPDCRFAQPPIRVTWFDPSGPPRPLKWIEDQLVYGVRVRESKPGQVTFTIAADDTRPVTLEATRSPKGCGVRARIRILGEWAEPRHAFVSIVGKSVIPDVSHVDLHGRREDGTATCERIAALRAPGAACPQAR